MYDGTYQVLMTNWQIVLFFIDIRHRGLFFMAITAAATYLLPTGLLRMQKDQADNHCTAAIHLSSINYFQYLFLSTFVRKLL